MADDNTLAEMIDQFGEGAPISEARPDPRRGPEYLQRGMFGEALFSANLMLASDDRVGIFWRIRAGALFGLGRFADAKLAFDRVVALGGGAERNTTHLRARCLVALGDIPAAQQLILADMHGRDVEPAELLELQQLLIELHQLSPTPSPPSP